MCVLLTRPGMPLPHVHANVWSIVCRAFHSTMCYLLVSLLGFPATSNGFHSFRFKDQSFLGSLPCVSFVSTLGIHSLRSTVLPEDGNTRCASPCALAIPKDNLLRLRVAVYTGCEGVDGCIRSKSKGRHPASLFSTPALNILQVLSIHDEAEVCFLQKKKIAKRSSNGICMEAGRFSGPA